MALSRADQAYWGVDSHGEKISLDKRHRRVVGCKQSKPTYVVKATWRATSLTLLIVASSEDDAMLKASRMKCCKGCLDFAVIEVRKP